MPRARHRSEAVDVDHGQVVYPSLEDVALVRGLNELGPVRGRASGRCERRRDQVRQTIETLKRRELHDARSSRPRGLPAATGSDPVGRLVSGEHVADAGDAAVFAADHGEPLEREGGPGAVSEKMFETPKIAGHVAVDERDPDTRVD